MLFIKLYITVRNDAASLMEGAGSMRVENSGYTENSLAGSVVSTSLTSLYIKYIYSTL